MNFFFAQRPKFFPLRALGRRFRRYRTLCGGKVRCFKRESSVELFIIIQPSPFRFSLSHLIFSSFLVFTQCSGKTLDTFHSSYLSLSLSLQEFSLSLYIYMSNIICIYKETESRSRKSWTVKYSCDRCWESSTYIYIIYVCIAKLARWEWAEGFFAVQRNEKREPKLTNHYGYTD